MKRPSPAPLSLAGAALLCGLCAACTERQLIDHPGETLDSVADSWPGSGGTFDPTATSADGTNVGNFPDPAIAECGTLPPGVDPIAGLTSAWAVAGNAPGNDGDGLPFPDDAVRLRFSDYGAGCDESFAGIAETCVSAWAFALSLPLSDLTPRVYDLASLSNLYPELQVSMSVDDECAGEGIAGGGAGPGAEPEGELEIFSVTGGCVMGELRGLVDTSGDLDVDRNGGFVAMRCESDCVPIPGNDCGQ